MRKVSGTAYNVAGTGPAGLHPPQFIAGTGPAGLHPPQFIAGTGPAGLHPPQFRNRRREIPVNSAIRSLLLAAGVVLILVAIAWPVLSKYFGRLPGDVVVRRPGFTCVFPIVTCLVLSLLLSLLFWLFRR